MSTLLLTRDNVAELIEAVTVNGKLVVESPEDHMKLARLARAYSKAVKAMINPVLKGVSQAGAVTGSTISLNTCKYL